MSARNPVIGSSSIADLIGSSGTFLASELLSGKRAAQGWFSVWLGVLPKSSPRGVGVEPTQKRLAKLFDIDRYAPTR